MAIINTFTKLDTSLKDYYRVLKILLLVILLLLIYY